MRSVKKMHRGMRIALILIALTFLLLLAGCKRVSTETESTVAEISVATERPETYVFEESPEGVEQTPEPSLAPMPTPTPTPEPSPTPYLTEALNPEEGVYTIGWISDSQHYNKKFPETFVAQTQFFADNQEKLHLKYIVFTGDFVHNRDEEEQWENASNAMEIIDDIPNGVLAGNHDVDVSDDENDYTLFKKYFGAKRYNNKSWYGGTFDDNRGHYDLIDAGKTKYIFVYLGYNVDSEGMDWVNATLAANRDRVGVLCVHGYFDSDLTRTSQGNQLYKNVVATNPNLYMVLCGHRYNCACVSAKFDDDGDGKYERTVLQMIQNYQAAGASGGDGYLRLLEVDEAAGVIRHYSYSPLLDDFIYFDTEEHQKENHSFSPEGEVGELQIPWTIE